MKNTNFKIILFTQIVGLLAGGILNFAMALHILDKTGSATIFATIVSIAFIPTIIFGPISGVLADRLPKKMLMMIADGINAVLILALGMTMVLGIESIPFIGVVLTGMTTLMTAYHPIVSSVLPTILVRDDLVKANAQVQGVKALSRFAAPALGGLIYGAVNIYVIVIGIGLLYVISTIANLFLRLPKTDKGFTGSVLKAVGTDLRDGFTYITKTDPRLIKLAITFGVLTMSFMSVMTVAFPFVGRVVLGMSENQFGFAQAVTAIAMLGGALLASRPKIKPFLTTQYVGNWVLLIAVASLPVGISMLPGLGISNGWAFTIFTSGVVLVTIFFAVLNMILMSTIQQSAPRDMVGKATALVMAIMVLGLPPMQNVVGDLLDRVAQGYLPVYLIFFGVTAVIIITGLVKLSMTSRRGKPIQQQTKAS